MSGSKSVFIDASIPAVSVSLCVNAICEQPKIGGSVASGTLTVNYSVLQGAPVSVQVVNCPSGLGKSISLQTNTGALESVSVTFTPTNGSPVDVNAPAASLPATTALASACAG